MSRRYDCLTILTKLETDSTHDLTREEICWLQSQLRILFSMDKLQIQKYIGEKILAKHNALGMHHYFY